MNSIARRSYLVKFTAFDEIDVASTIIARGYLNAWLGRFGWDDSGRNWVQSEIGAPFIDGVKVKDADLEHSPDEATAT